MVGNMAHMGNNGLVLVVYPSRVLDPGFALLLGTFAGLWAAGVGMIFMLDNYSSLSGLLLLKLKDATGQQM